MPKGKTSDSNRTDWHHIMPTSIGGPQNNTENKYSWNIYKHRAYHQLFRNFPPSIVIRIIEGWTDENGQLNRKLMSHRDYKFWIKVFNDWMPAKAIKFIQKEFLPIEEKYLRGELGDELLADPKIK